MIAVLKLQIRLTVTQRIFSLASQVTSLPDIAFQLKIIMWTMPFNFQRTVIPATFQVIMNMKSRKIRMTMDRQQIMEVIKMERKSRKKNIRFEKEIRIIILN